MSVAPENHPEAENIMRYKAHDAVAAQVALQVYLDLCEVKNWLDIEIHHCESLKMCYFTGRELPTAELEVVVPLAVSAALSMAQIQRWFDHLDQPSSIILAVMDSDSTNAMYRMFSGIREPKESLILAEVKEEA